MPFNDIKDAFNTLAYAGVTTAEAIKAINMGLNQSVASIEQMKVETTQGRRRWIKSKSGKFLTQMEGKMYLTFLGEPTIYTYYDMPDASNKDYWYYTYCNNQKIVFSGRNCSFERALSPDTISHTSIDIWNYFVESDYPVNEELSIEEPELTKQEKNDIINIEENKVIDTEVNLSTLDFNAFLKENTIDYGY